MFFLSEKKFLYLLSYLLSIFTHIKATLLYVKNKLNCISRKNLDSTFIEIFTSSNSPDILALCETNLDNSIDSGNFSVRGYLPLIQKDSGTHLHDLAVYVNEGVPFAQDLSLENSADSYL